MEISTKRGFSLVELLVSISILSLLFLVVVSTYGVTQDRLALTSAGQNVAVSLRQAQAFGLSVRETYPNSSVFVSGYGIYMTKTNGSNDNFIIFADNNSNDIYDAGTGCGTSFSTTECVEKVMLNNSIKIISFDTGCSTVTYLCSIIPFGDAVNITFKRPNPNAVVYFSLGGAKTSSVSHANISISSPKGKIYTITVFNPGYVVSNVYGPAASK